MTKPTFAAALVTDIVLRELVIKMSSKLGRRLLAETAAKFAYKFASIALKSASKVLSKVGLKAAVALGNLGAKMATQAVEKAAAAAASKVAIKKAGTSLFTKLLGPAMFAFDIISFGLDVGDAGGYNKMGTKSMYLSMKKDSDKGMDDVYDDIGVIRPILKGPDIAIDKVVEIMTKRMEDPNDPIMKPMFDKMSEAISNDIKSGILKSEDIDNNPSVMDNYMKYIDSKLLMKDIMNKLCISNGGISITTIDPFSRYEKTEKKMYNKTAKKAYMGQSLGYCEKNCMDNSYCKSFSYRERRKLADGMIDDDDIDANCWIFDNAVDTKLLKDDSNTDTYNLVKNIPDNMDVCTFDKKNCESSFEWPLKEGQEYVEFKKATLKQNVDGTLKDIVVDACIPTNSLMKTVCDSNNIPYNKDTGICDITQDYCMQKGADWLYDNEIKDYDCGIDAGQEFGEALLGTTITRGLKQIFDPRQYESCKADETDDGYFCRKTKDCKTGEEECLGLCYPQCKSGFHPFGCNLCSPDCPKDAVDDGAFCRTMKCKDNEERNGALCYPKCKDGYDGVGPVCWEKCKPGFTDDGAFCRRAGYCPPEQERNGALCYPKCKDGYDGVGPVCWEKCKPGWVDDGAFCRKVCSSTLEQNGALCYPYCEPGYDGWGPVCWKQCPDGYTDTGLYCAKSPPKSACPSNMRDDGTSCWLDTYGNGVGTIPDQCPAGQHNVLGQCWGHNYYSWGSIGCRDGVSNAVCGYFGCGGGYGYNDCYDIENIKGSAQCPAGKVNVAGLCYNQCKPGYHFVGGNLCEPDGGPGIRLTLDQRIDCGPNTYKYFEGKDQSGQTLAKAPNLLARKQCEQFCENTSGCKGIVTYSKGKDLGECWAVKGFPSPNADTNSAIAVKLETPKNSVLGLCSITQDSYGRGAGEAQTVIVTKDSYGRGVGEPDTTIKTKDSYGRTAGTVPDTKITSKPNTSYGRGVATGSAVSIRAKKRKINFSTKENFIGIA